MKKQEAEYRKEEDFPKHVGSRYCKKPFRSLFRYLVLYELLLTKRNTFKIRIRFWAFVQEISSDLRVTPDDYFPGVNPRITIYRSIQIHFSGTDFRPSAHVSVHVDVTAGDDQILGYDRPAVKMDVSSGEHRIPRYLASYPHVASCRSQIVSDLSRNVQISSGSNNAFRSVSRNGYIAPGNGQISRYGSLYGDTVTGSVKIVPDRRRNVHRISRLGCERHSGNGQHEYCRYQNVYGFHKWNWK